MAEEATHTMDLASVVWMPAAVSPFKSGTVASGAQRLEMLRLAIRDADLPGAAVSDFELNRPGPSYSWETATHFRDVEPDTVWHWILGTDQWDQIERWAEPEILRGLLHFIVFTRRGQPVAERPGWRFTPVEFEHPASSTAIRSDFEAHAGWLVPSVAAYCREAGLYR